MCVCDSGRHNIHREVVGKQSASSNAASNTNWARPGYYGVKDTERRT